MDDARKFEGFRSAGGRLSEALRPELDRHRSDLVLDKLEAVHAFDKAHAVMLTEEGLLDAESGRAILGGLRDMETPGVVESRLASGGGLHSGEYHLTKTLGSDIGGRIHLGRSSGDLAGVSRRLVTRDRLLAVMSVLNRVRRGLVQTTPSCSDIVMPMYTHGQQAQPTTYGHWLAMWSAVFERDFRRLRTAFDGINRSPAGAGTGTGSDFPLNRQRTAELLGFDGVLINTMDAILSNDAFMECLAALRILAANVARLAEDLLFWSTSEVGMITIPDRFCDTSSIMAQKRNPYVLHEMRALSTEAAAALATGIDADAGATGQGIIGRKLAEGGAWSLFAHTLLRLDEAADLMPAVAVKIERMSELVENGWSQATDVAATLVRETGMSWRSAHQVTGILVRIAEERGIAPSEVTLELINEAAAQYHVGPLSLSSESLANGLNARSGAYRRTGVGGPSPERVLKDAVDATARLDQDEADLDACRCRLKDSAMALDRTVDLILGQR